MRLTEEMKQQLSVANEIKRLEGQLQKRDEIINKLHKELLNEVERRVRAEQMCVHLKKEIEEIIGGTL